MVDYCSELDESSIDSSSTTSVDTDVQMESYSD